LQLDVFMVSILSDGELSDTGVYTIALFIANVVIIPSKAITAIAAPIISQSWTKNNTQKIQNIYRKSSLNGLIAGIFLMICIWLSIDDLFRIMPNGERYDGGKYVVLILGLTKLFDMATSVNQHVIGYSKYFRFNFYAVLILAILNIFSNYIFIP